MWALLRRPFGDRAIAPGVLQLWAGRCGPASLWSIHTFSRHHGLFQESGHSPRRGLQPTCPAVREEEE